MGLGRREKIFVVTSFLTVVIVLIFLLFLSKSELWGRNEKWLKQKKEMVLAKDLLYQNVLKHKTLDFFPGYNFFPKNKEPVFADDFGISAKAYAVMDRDKNELLYGKNLTLELPIASITKIATALVALENAQLEDIFTVSSEAVKVGEASMFLSAGERLSLEELLYGLMLPSGNDAAETLAEGVGINYLKKNNFEVDRKMGRAWFIDEMNRKAQSLGMYDTYFFNPTGLDGETLAETSFSTAFDLLALTNYALENSIFAKIAQTKKIYFPKKEGFHKEFYLENILQFDKSFKGIKGVKPGNSIFAKETLVSYAEWEGRRIILVILGSNFTKDDAVRIYKRIFK